MKMFVISDNVDTRTGLRLVGIDGAVVHTAKEMSDALDAVLRDKDIGILLVMEKLTALSPDRINDIKLNRHTPLIVEIPDRHGTGRKPDFLSAYIREAIGVKLN